jgi:predicted DNA-binding transcriptional regulator AlpA
MQDNINSTPRYWASDTDLADYFRVSRATIWRWTRIGKLPAPTKLGENTTRWKFSEAVEAVTGEKLSA